MPFESVGCILPTAAEVIQLQREMEPRYARDKRGMEIMPMLEVETPEIVLYQPEVYGGLQLFRGVGKPIFTIDPQPLGTWVRLKPGAWGEKDEIGEEEITNWGQIGSCNKTIDLTGYITMMQQRLMERRYNRVEFNIWQTLVFGKYQALSRSGQVLYQAEFNITNISAEIPWTDYANASPLNDFRMLKLLGRGTDARFDSCARAIMNQKTANELFKNRNPFDLGRGQLSACCALPGPAWFNQQFGAQDLPQIEIYDGGFYDDNRNYNIYIPDGYVVVIGCRPNNVPPGHYFLTRNAMGCVIDSGFWQKIHDNCSTGLDARKIEVGDGHNGGPAIEYPRQVVVMRVY